MTLESIISRICGGMYGEPVEQHSASESQNPSSTKVKNKDAARLHDHQLFGTGTVKSPPLASLIFLDQ